MVGRDSQDELGIFIGHGTANRRVPIRRARDAYELLTSAGLDVDLRLYATDHWLCPTMLRDVDRWILTQCHRQFDDGAIF
jgi:predicted esterase